MTKNLNDIGEADGDIVPPAKKVDTQVNGVSVEGIVESVESAVPGSSDQSEKYPRFSQSISSKLQSQAGDIVRDIAVLLEQGQLDETDRKTITEAVAFIENPTENLADIMRHTTHIGEVLGGFIMQGEDAPPAIDAMHGYLFSLQCANKIHLVEDRLDHGFFASPELNDAMKLAEDWAMTLCKGYEDTTLYDVVLHLKQERKERWGE